MSAFIAMTGRVYGVPIYSQVLPPDPHAAFASQNSPIGPKVADNFLLEVDEPTTVRSLRLIGGYVVRNPPPRTPPLDSLPSDSFRVVFLADSGGSPGQIIFGGDFPVGSPMRRTPTGGNLLNGIYQPLEFVLDLSDGITLNPEAEYWIAIVNDPGPDHGWVWARATGLVDQRTAVSFDSVETGPWETPTNGGMFFELNDHNIPEPTTITICGIAAIARLLIGRKSKRNPSLH
jgi:hypothetical protein